MEVSNRCGALFNPSSGSSDQSIRRSGFDRVHAAPWPDTGTGRTEITWGATGNLFVSFPPCSCQQSAL